MKLSDWARKNGIDYKTAYRWFRANKMPIAVEQMSTGTILVYEDSLNDKCKKYVIYARVSSHDQKEDLKRQVDRLRQYCAKNGIIISSEISEIGSGLNDNRKKLLKLLSDINVNIIVEHKDRLSRFGFNMIETLLKSNNRKIIVINNSEIKEDLVQDFIDVATSMCAKIYGRRGAKNRAIKALESTK